MAHLNEKPHRCKGGQGWLETTINELMWWEAVSNTNFNCGTHERLESITSVCPGVPHCSNAYSKFLYLFFNGLCHYCNFWCDYLVDIVFPLMEKQGLDMFPSYKQCPPQYPIYSWYLFKVYRMNTCIFNTDNNVNQKLANYVWLTDQMCPATYFCMAVS